MKQTFIRKSISILLALLMLLAVPVAAVAAETEVVLSGKAGDSVTWTLTNDGVLTVSGTGPIVDITEEETDEDGMVCVTTLDSIGMTFDRYFNDHREGMTAADAVRLRFDLCKEIVVEEGITEIPAYEFDAMLPRRVTLPSTLESMGYDAFNLLYAESITVSSVKLPELDIYVPAYADGAVPYKSCDEARESYIEQHAAEEALEYEMLFYDVLYTYAYMLLIPDEAVWPQMEDESRQEMLDLYNKRLGTRETTLEALVPAALQALNKLFGTAYTDVKEIFTVDVDELGNRGLAAEPGLQEKIDAKYANAGDDDRLISKPLAMENVPLVAYDWFTVTAPAGGKIEKDCKESGVNFIALEGVSVPAEENENACKYCGADHSTGFWQKIVGFFHNIFYFFAHLFGRM